MGTPVRIGLTTVIHPADSAPQTLLQRELSYSLAAALGHGDRRPYTISAAAFQAFTVPTGAKYCLIEIPAGAESLTLKGVTGDTGIPLTDGTAANVPKMVVLLPVDGSSPALGITNGGNAEVTVTVTML